MELLAGAESTSIYARPLVPEGGGVAVTLDEDRERSYKVGEHRSTPKSPLNLLLGLDGSDTRIFSLVAWGVGLDWATAAIGGDQLADGSVLAGAEVLEIVRDALDQIEADLHALMTAVDTVLGLGLLEPGPAKEAIEKLDQLCEDVTVIALWESAAATFVDGHRSESLLGLAAVEALRIASRSGRVVECAYCGRKFVPHERADELYCRRSVPGGPSGGRTCRQVGPQRRYAEGMGAVTAAYRRSYKRLDNRVRRGQLQRWRVDEWRVQAKALVDRAQRRGWSIEKFEQELESLNPEREE